MFVWNVSYPMIQNVLLFFLLRDILRLRDLLSYSFKPLYLFILQGLSRKRVYRKIFKGLDWISFVQIKVWKNTSQIRGIKERSFYAIHNTMHFHSSILQHQAVFTSFVKSCLKVYYLLESAFVCFCILLYLYIYSYKILQRCLSVRISFL